MDFMGPAPLGSQAALLALSQQRRTPELKSVDPGDRSDGTGNDARRRPQQDETAAVARDIVALRRETSQRDLPVGPPPTFEISLLELESDIKHVLARIEADRAKARNANAPRLEAGSQAAAASAKAEAPSQTVAEAETSAPAETGGAPAGPTADGTAPPGDGSGPATGGAG